MLLSQPHRGPAVGSGKVWLCPTVSAGTHGSRWQPLSKICPIFIRHPASPHGYAFHQVSQQRRAGPLVPPPLSLPAGCQALSLGLSHYPQPSPLLFCSILWELRGSLARQSPVQLATVLEGDRKTEEGLGLLLSLLFTGQWQLTLEQPGSPTCSSTDPCRTSFLVGSLRPPQTGQAAPRAQTPAQQGVS